MDRCGYERQIRVLVPLNENVRLTTGKIIRAARIIPSIEGAMKDTLLRKATDLLPCSGMLNYLATKLTKPLLFRRVNIPLISLIILEPPFPQGSCRLQ